MEKIYKIADKTGLHEVLHQESYDKIVFWETQETYGGRKVLVWDQVSSSYECSVDFAGRRQYPLYTISRVMFYNKTHAQIRRLLDGIEENDYISVGGERPLKEAER